MDDVIWCYMVLEFWLASWRWFTCSTWINIVFFFRLLHYQEAPMIVASSGLATTCFSLGQLKQLLKGSRYMLKLCHDHVPATRIFVFKRLIWWMAVGTYSQVLVWRCCCKCFVLTHREWLIRLTNICFWRWEHCNLEMAYWTLTDREAVIFSSQLVTDRAVALCLAMPRISYPLPAGIGTFGEFWHLGAQPITSHYSWGAQQPS